MNSFNGNSDSLNEERNDEININFSGNIDDKKEKNNSNEISNSENENEIQSNNNIDSTDDQSSTFSSIDNDSEISFTSSEESSIIDKNDLNYNSLDFYSDISPSFPLPSGTMYNQSKYIIIYKDYLSPKLVYTCGNNDKRILEQDEHNENILSSKEFSMHRAIPSLPLTLSPLVDSSGYTFSFFFHILENAYYKNAYIDPIEPYLQQQYPIKVEDGWHRGILSLYMNIDKDLKL